MYTALFLVQAFVQLLLLFWIVRIWKNTGLSVAFALFLPQFGLVYDNARVGLGSFIGLGPTLEALSWPAFWIHWLFGAWLIIVCGSVLRLAGFDWAKNKAVMASFCILTVIWMLYDLPYFWTKSLHPVCELDLVRYSVQVSADKFCLPNQVEVAGGGPPWPQLSTCIIVIITGAMLWAKRGFPWMFWGGLLMFISAMPPLMRLKLDNLGEVLIAGGCIWAIAHFSRGVVAPRAAVPAQT
jgi:hypothetical protein